MVAPGNDLVHCGNKQLEFLKTKSRRRLGALKSRECSDAASHGNCNLRTSDQEFPSARHGRWLRSQSCFSTACRRASGHNDDWKPRRSGRSTTTPSFRKILARLDVATASSFWLLS